MSNNAPSRTKPLALLALVVVVAVALFVVLKPGGSSSGQSERPAAVTTPATTPSAGTTTPATTTPAKPAPAAVPAIRIAGGQPVGGVHRIAVSKGDRVRFAVTNDQADEVHVHGYNIEREIAAGGRVSFDFPATIDGVFEVELHHSGAKIAELRVSP